MGYNTQFSGKLTISPELSRPELAYLKMLLEDDGLYGLVLSEDRKAIQWSVSEKTYDMECQVNNLIDLMQEEVEDFALSGEMSAQGEDIDDRWNLVIKNGEAIRVEVSIPKPSDKYKCPCCRKVFLLSDAEKQA